jgi:Flp pilus assembly protein TadB
MEFDEMKKIWDSQNDEPLYAINEAALHRSIKSQKERANRKANFSDFGLSAIFIATAIINIVSFIVNGTPTIYDYLIVIMLLLITGYIWFARIRRKKREQMFGHTMLGDLDHAISSVKYRAWRSKNMVWWLVLPVAVLVFLNVSQAGASLWAWIGIAAAFVVSALLSRWGYNHCDNPRLRKLEALRDKLTEEAEAPSL